MNSLTNKYLLSFKNHATVFIVTYYNGSFKRLEYKSGGLADKVWNNVSHAIPQNEVHIKKILNTFKDKVFYELINEANPKSLYTKFMDRYFSFYDKYSEGLKPKITSVEGKALKEIISYLNEQSATEEEAYNVWCLILNQWENIEDFYRKQINLKQINSNLNNILIQIKDGTSSKSKSTTNSLAAAFRDRYKS